MKQITTPLFMLALAACATSTSSTPATTASAPADGASDAAADGKAAAEAPPAPPPSRTGNAAVDAPDRELADRALDLGRKPAELLEFIGVKPGMKVGELFAGGGYTTELLARSVGETGVVYAQNNKAVLEKFADNPAMNKPWSTRLAKPVMKNVVRVDRELEDPFPPEAKDLDVVVMVLAYHDSVHLKTDRAKMNKAVLAALKTGGSFVIVDHTAKPGTGTADAGTLHRIEETAVIDELLKAGFVPGSQASFLRNPSDTRDWNASPIDAGEKRGTSDRFVLEVKKPDRQKAVNSSKH